MLNRHVDTRKKTIPAKRQPKRYISPDGVTHSVLPALWHGKGGLTDDNCEALGWTVEDLPTAPEITLPITTAPRQALVAAALQAMLSGDDWQPLHVIAPAKDQPPVADLALIMCHYGQGAERIEANKRALTWTMQSDPKPAVIIFVEAAGDDEPLHFEYLADFGVTHITRRIPKGGEGLWLKEPLWDIAANIALQSETITKLCFLDADCSFADQSWAPQVSEALDDLDIISPHSCAYYAESVPDMTYGLMRTVGYQIEQAKGKDAASYGHPGMAVAMTRQFYQSLGRLPYVSVGSGDTYMWYRIAGRKLFPCQPSQIAYQPTILESKGMRPRPRMGCAGQVLCHHDHGSIKATRIYLERWIAFNAAIQRPETDHIINEDGMPMWRNEAGTRIIRPALEEIRTTKITAAEGVWTRRVARDIYDKHAMAEYGPIDDDHPLVVATLLRSGGQYDARHVIWLRDQFAAMCKAPHRFVCLSDIVIDGIEMIPLALSNNQSPGWWGQLEYFRPGIFPAGASVLCCDLDTVLYREFTPHRCPADTIAMSREINNWSKSSWAIWNAGLMYFNGDFSGVWSTYDIDINYRFSDPQYHCPGSQEYIVACLLSQGDYPVDIVRHFCYSFYEGDCRNFPSETQIACFPMTPKPWDIQPRPWCVPELHKE